MIQCKNACPLGKFDRCCRSCPDYDGCDEACTIGPNACEDSIFDDESGLQAFQDAQLATLNAIASLTAHKKAIEEQEKAMKAALMEAMEKYGIKKFDSDLLTLTYVAPTVTHGIDSAKLKKKYPDVAAACAKDTPKAGYVKITLKDGGGKDEG